MDNPDFAKKDASKVIQEISLFVDEAANAIYLTTQVLKNSLEITPIEQQKDLLNDTLYMSNKLLILVDEMRNWRDKESINE
jgi:hypothetical protein